MNMHKVCTRLLVFICAAVLLLSFAPSAYAVSYYYTAAWTDVHYGLSGEIYVMSGDPAVTSGDFKVNSIWCVTSDSLQQIEMGWCFHHDMSGYENKPYHFIQFVRDGQIVAQPHVAATRGATARYTTRCEFNGTYKCYRDSVFVGAYTTPMTSCLPGAQAEIHHAGDSNYADISRLLFYAKSDKGYHYWTTMNWQDDPGDNYHFVKVSNYHFSSVHN